MNRKSKQKNAMLRIHHLRMAVLMNSARNIPKAWVKTFLAGLSLVKTRFQRRSQSKKNSNQEKELPKRTCMSSESRKRTPIREAKFTSTKDNHTWDSQWMKVQIGSVRPRQQKAGTDRVLHTELTTMVTMTGRQCLGTRRTEDTIRMSTIAEEKTSGTNER